MKKSRLSLILESGALALPEDGPIAIYGAGADDDLRALPKDRCEIIQGFKPDHDALLARGFQVVVAANGPYAASIVMLDRSKAKTRMMLAEAVAKTPNGLIIVDGLKTQGADGFYKECRKRLAVSEAFSKAHGKLFWFTSEAVFDDWADAGPIQLEEDFQTVAGVFSAEKIDRGSRALIAALPEKLPKRLADLGAGWGYLSRHILMREKIRELHLIEADYAALECARKNVTDPRAHFHWADAARFIPAQPFDGIITNPPFHTSRKADPDIGRGFITAAAGMLTPSGQLWLVANRHLPYERTLAETFRNVDEIAGDNSFKILRATKPLRGNRSQR
ncbi:class I SAM-dependent methyltransferase [Profundibacter sp.]